MKVQQQLALADLEELHQGCPLQLDDRAHIIQAGHLHQARVVGRRQKAQGWRQRRCGGSGFSLGRWVQAARQCRHDTISGR